MKNKETKQWKKLNLVRQDQLGKGKTRLYSQRVIPNKKREEVVKQTTRELHDAILDIQGEKTNDTTNKRIISIVEE